MICEYSIRSANHDVARHVDTCRFPETLFDNLGQTLTSKRSIGMPHLSTWSRNTQRSVLCERWSNMLCENKTRQGTISGSCHGSCYSNRDHSNRLRQSRSLVSVKTHCSTNASELRSTRVLFMVKPKLAHYPLMKDTECAGSHYDVLGISIHADYQEIRTAYRDKAKTLHTVSNILHTSVCQNWLL